MSGQPPEKETTQLPVVPAWAIELTRSVKTGFASVDARLDEMERNVSILVDDKRVVNDRLSRIENWKETEVNARLDTSSLRAKQGSAVDMAHEAAIADVVVKVTELTRTQEKQLAILLRLDAIAANPMVRRVAYTLGAAVLIYFAGKGIVVR